VNDAALLMMNSRAEKISLGRHCMYRRRGVELTYRYTLYTETRRDGRSIIGLIAGHDVHGERWVTSRDICHQYLAATSSCTKHTLNKLATATDDALYVGFSMLGLRPSDTIPLTIINVRPKADDWLA